MANRRHTGRSGVLVSRRFRLLYLAITAAFVVAAFGFAAAQIWVVALACLLMGGAMTGASLQMRERERGDDQRRSRDRGYDGRDDPRD